ncbi:MAG: hypothetical protein RID91_07080 [Azospirillaceae bacterium]
MTPTAERAPIAAPATGRGLATPLDQIDELHTLGPTGTNCEAAAHHWFALRGRPGRIALHDTLERALEAMRGRSGAALLGCAVYPELHTLVFSHLDRVALADSFLMPTFEMVLAARGPDVRPRTVATHPAPQGLVPAGSAKTLVDSNAAAAIACAEGRVDGCITTGKAAAAHGLTVLWSAGPVPMVFTVHAPIAAPEAAEAG